MEKKKNPKERQKILKRSLPVRSELKGHLVDSAP